MTPAPLVRYHEVRFAYAGSERPALDGVTFAAAEGEGVALFGANGAGKSTILRLAMGLERGASGAVESAGLDATTAPPEAIATVAGFLFQQPETQLFEPTVARDVAFGPRCLGWDTARIEAAVRGSLEEVGLGAVADVHPYDLPAPHRRLVALAAVLATGPRLLLLDEPTAALDRASRETVRRVVRRRRDAGVTVLAVTHDGEFALEALDRALLVDRGRIVADDSVVSLLGRPGAPDLPAPAVLARRLGLRVPVPRTADVLEALLGALPQPSAPR
ncbi:MAG TPA: ABC transporter ATP-binding protein [Gemmatimonadales bacterium]